MLGVLGVCFRGKSFEFGYSVARGTTIIIPQSSSSTLWTDAKFHDFQNSKQSTILRNKVQEQSSSSLLPGQDVSYLLINPYSSSFKNRRNTSLDFCQIVTRGITTTSKMATTNGSLARQNYHEECEAHINRQINMELYASYVYMSMAYYFDRDDIAFPGLHKFFKKCSDEEREHAEKFMKYQNMRGGRITLQPVAKPSKDEWNSPLDAVTAALELEKTVNMTLLDIHGIASKNNDPQLCDFLETNFLEEQVQAIKELSDYVTQLKRCGTGLGEYLFDKEIEEKA